MFFIIGDWNAKVGSQEIPRRTGKFVLGVQNEAGKNLTECCQENTLAQQTPFSNNPRDDSKCGYHQMVSTKIRLIMFFASKDREALCNQ